ncbi:MAG: hypothetical protein KAW12_01350 [Candidatus Aminicenantes bacterium]|nr:hypothetical protein [Candidatus Aminicenantes bacterium]
MKKTAFLFIMLMLVSTLSIPVQGEDKILSDYEKLITARQYSDALSLLSKAIRANSADPARQAAYIKTMGDFHREVCGDMRRAEMNYRRILNSPVPAGHPAKQAAGEALAGLKKTAAAHRQINTRLKTLMSRASRKREPEAVKKDVAQLLELIENNPGWYLRHEAYYALGLNYRALGKNRQVYRMMKKAMEIKPGIVFYLPAKTQAQQARAAYIRGNVNTAAAGVFWLLLAVTMVLFYKSRPWRRLRFKHFLPLIVLLLCWWLVFNIAHFLIGKSFGDSGSQVEKQVGVDIRYLSALPGSPGSEIMEPLFLYGITGLAAIFIFSLGLRQFKRGKLTLVFSLLYGFLLFSAFTTLYYMKYWDGVSLFHSEGKGISYYTGGQFQHYPEEPEPNVLTNPQAYPNIEVSKVPDPYLRAWIEKHCPNVNKN